MGGKTHIISLPLKWIKKYGVKKGDELEVVEKDNKIEITTNKVPEKSPIKINLEKANAAVIIRNITTYYQLGYSGLELVFSKKTINEKTNVRIDTLNIIQDTCDQLIGFEIIDQKDNYCRIKDVAGNDINEFKNVLRRIFLMLNSFGDELLENMNNYPELDNLHRKHIMIRKYIHYCQRFLNIKGMENKTSQYNELVMRLLDVSITYRFISKNQCIKKNVYPKEIKDVVKKMVVLQDEFYNLFYKFSLEQASELSRKRVDVFREINELSEKARGEDLILLQRVPFVLNTILSLMNVTFAINFVSHEE